MAGFDLRVVFPFSFRRGLKTLWPKRRSSMYPNKCFCVLKVFKISPHEHQKGKKQKILIDAQDGRKFVDGILPSMVSLLPQQ